MRWKAHFTFQYFSCNRQQHFHETAVFLLEISPFKGDFYSHTHLNWFTTDIISTTPSVIAGKIICTVKKKKYEKKNYSGACFMNVNNIIFSRSITLPQWMLSNTGTEETIQPFFRESYEKALLRHSWLALMIIQLSSERLAAPRISVESLQAGTADNPISIASRNIFSLVLASLNVLWPRVVDS